MMGLFRKAKGEGKQLIQRVPIGEGEALIPVGPHEIFMVGDRLRRPLEQEIIRMRAVGQGSCTYRLPATTHPEDQKLLSHWPS